MKLHIKEVTTIIEGGGYGTANKRSDITGKETNQELL